MLEGGKVVEFRNQSASPTMTLMVDRDEMAPYMAKATATWHTHPKNNVNLSAPDHAMFLTLPSLRHYIVTERRIRAFEVRNGKVMLYEADCV